MHTLTLGDVSISRIVEIGRSSFPTAQMLPESDAGKIASHHRWIKPHFFDDVTGDLGSRIQTWIVRTPRQVDLVLCTHLHVDHVGWNTRLVDGRWVPTFPRAQYVFPGEEWEFWKYEEQAGREKSGCIADSVLPVVEAGQAVLVSSTHQIDPWLAYEPWVGHTPGHAAVRAHTRAGDAVFSGDLMHRVVQVAEPQWSSTSPGPWPPRSSPTWAPTSSRWSGPRATTRASGGRRSGKASRRASSRSTPTSAGSRST